VKERKSQERGRKRELYSEKTYKRAIRRIFSHSVAEEGVIRKRGKRGGKKYLILLLDGGNLADRTKKKKKKSSRGESGRGKGIAKKKKGILCPALCGERGVHCSAG